VKKDTYIGKKSLFKSSSIRKLYKNEIVLYTKVNLLLQRKRQKATIAVIPDFVCHDGKSRALILHIDIVNKIEHDHEKIVLENLIINANDWDYIIRNVDNDKDKINLIKMIPDTPYFLTIGANRINGFFVVTHYESRPKTHNTLKNLLHNKGDSLENIERTALPHLQLSHNVTASQLGLSGVNS
jgi:hypothetical protein